MICSLRCPNYHYTLRMQAPICKATGEVVIRAGGLLCPRMKPKERRCNTKPLLSEVLRHGFTYVKFSNSGKGRENWKPKHVWVWERAHGEIPKGYRVIFLDNSRSNFDLGNLEIVTRKEDMLLGSLGLKSGDPEITKTGLAIARLHLAAHKKLSQALGKADHRKFRDKMCRERKMRGSSCQNI